MSENFFGDLFPGAAPAPGATAPQQDQSATPTAPVVPTAPATPASPPAEDKQNFFADLFPDGGKASPVTPPAGGAETSPPAPETGVPATGGSVAKQAGWGLVSGTTGMLGSAMNALTGRDTANQISKGILNKFGADVPEIPSFGDTYNQGLGLAGLNPNAPERLPQNMPERIARGLGEGAVGMAVPEIGAARFLGKAGETLAPYLGSGTAKSLLANTAKGAVIGGASAAAQEAVPDAYKPLAGAVAGVGVPLLAHGAGAAYRAAGKAIPPQTEAARDLAVGERLNKAAGPDADRIIADQGDIAAKRNLPDSPQTMGPAFNSQGLKAREGQIMGGSPDYDDLRQQQETARLKAVPTGIGDSTAAPQFYRDMAGQIDKDTQRQVEAAHAGAQQAGQPLQGLTPEGVGGAGRSVLEDVDTAEKARMKELFTAIDPDNKLSVVSSPLKETDAKEYGNMTDEKAKGVSPQETTIRNFVQGYGDWLPFNKLSDLRSLISGYMRETVGGTESYNRLSQFRSAADSAIERTLQQVQADEARQVAAGTLHPDDTMAGRLDALRAKQTSDLDAAGQGAGEVAPRKAVAGGEAGVPPLRGAGGQGDGGLGNPAGNPGVQNRVPASPAEDAGVSKVFYPGGSLDVQHELAELKDLVASHDMDFKANPAYPQNLQPRDRSAAGAQDQVNQLAANLNPERLGKSTEYNAGAPIVGPDNVVESGNGRVMALAKRYAKNQNTNYTEWLKSQGYDTSGYQQPVLVGRRATPLSPEAREYVARSGAARQGLALSPIEAAQNDAKLLTPDVLEKASTAPLTAKENRDFVGAFMGKLPANERAALIDKDKNLTQDGVRRIQAAVTHAAYGDATIIDQAFQSTDPTIKGLAQGLVDAAPAWAKLKAAVAKGEISPDHDISGGLLADVHGIIRAREEGFPATRILEQSSMFGTDTNAHSLLFDQAKDGWRLNGGKRVAEKLTAYVEDALKNDNAPRLIGEAAPAKDVLKGALSRVQRTLGEEEAAPGPEAANANEPSFAKGAQEKPVPQAPTREQAESLFNRTKEYREYSERKRPIAGMLNRAPFNTSPYKITDKGMVGQLWGRDTAGADKVDRYLNFAGKTPQAIKALSDAAAYSLKGRMEGGELTPARFATWRREHAPAIASLEKVAPGTTARFESLAAAREAVTKAETARKEAMAEQASSAAGKMMNLDSADSVRDRIGQILQGQGSVEKMRDLVTKADKDGSGQARAGLQQAVSDHILSKFRGKEIGDTGEFSLKGNDVAKWVRDNDQALSTVMTPAQMERIRAMAKDQESTAGIAVAAKNRKPAEEAQPKGGSMARSFQNYAQKAASGVVWNGLGWLFGGAPGVAATTAAMAFQEFRKAGLAKVDAAEQYAIMHPDVGRALMRLAREKGSQGSVLNLRTRLAQSALRGAMVHEEPRKRHAAGG